MAEAPISVTERSFVTGESLCPLLGCAAWLAYGRSMCGRVRLSSKEPVMTAGSIDKNFAILQWIIAGDLSRADMSAQVDRNQET